MPPEFEWEGLGEIAATEKNKMVAVRNWPDPAFFPHIKKVHESQIVPTIGFNFWQLLKFKREVIEGLRQMINENEDWEY